MIQCERHMFDVVQRGIDGSPIMHLRVIVGIP